jgi:hypothetical protein
MEMAVELMEMAPGAIPRPGRVPEQRLLSPKIMAVVLQNFTWMDADSSRVFAMKGIYKRKGNVKGRLGGPHHLVAWPAGDPRHPMVWPAPGPPPSLLWTPSS